MIEQADFEQVLLEENERVQSMSEQFVLPANWWIALKIFKKISIKILGTTEIRSME